MRRLFIPATVLALALTGCTPANAPAGTPAQPDASGATVPTSAATAARSTTASAPPATTPAASPAPPSATSSAALAQEAEQVLREFQKEWDRLAAADLPAPTPRLKELLAEPMLSDISKVINVRAGDGRRLNGRLVVRDIKLANAMNFPGAKVGLTACIDGTKATTRGPGGTVQGALLQMTVYFKHVNGTLMAFDGESHKVAKCPA